MVLLIVTFFVVRTHLFALDVTRNVLLFEFVNNFFLLESFLMFSHFLRLYDMVNELGQV